MTLGIRRLPCLVCSAVFLIGCGKTDRSEDLLQWTLAGEYPLAVPEPSGLALSIDNQRLWTVSDKTSKVYQLSLQGEMLSSFKVDGSDLEGIAVISDSILCVVTERTGELIFLTLEGEEVERRQLAVTGGGNRGYEGLAYDRTRDRYFLVKEKNPRMLFEFDGEMNEFSRRQLNSPSDLSGLDYDHESGMLWLASHESRLVARLSQAGEIISQLAAPVRQLEGLAYDSTARLLYLVCDEEARLYVLQLSAD